MEFATFILAAQRGYHQSPDIVIRNSIEQAIVSEQAGFGTAWFAEHHFNNYSLIPSPLMMVAHCAGVTSTIRLGTAICVLPLYKPQRLLSEIGFADILANGRLELGVGSGYQQFEFERFGVNIDEAPAIFSEHLDILLKGLNQNIFEHDGHYEKIPPTAISVPTVQRPTPPIWMAGGPARMKRAYREGHNFFVTAFHDGLETLSTLRGAIKEVAASEDRNVTAARISLLRCCYASDDGEEIKSYLDNARFQRRLSEALHQRRQQSHDGYLLQETPTQQDLSFEAMRNNMPIGSVNRVIDRLLEEIDILKPDQIAIQTQLGDFDQRTMLRQIELWGDKIIPAINKALGHARV
ncbi:MULTISPECIES: LLM class flavin-dependent oxidoreductase [Mesorhizobium]|uniref:Flavin-dependent oxidoreductase, luciferase family (Includes alkanesulfonate monooxygenase SsuD and methylene tetrahydromethanopterin reductase) n=1 Tax=Mesorhizobium qingshengii TaxID=1165689 RepID=A0A1G5ZYQ6_9HYPH|nr:LLM class flavin-dependent oxidoreductase [Mesorhizobium qingshengii]AID34777.1 LLM class flavin-dependent oxidoreductase [Mesorhizobium huakuii 7653R]MCH4561090.1 LLM class flavin-dependent oxidoreductase [Mesorhizobium jarvisii]SDA99686.1 Flavin-dependent oxidoreductase, luciferase family (includes alkanesulfonate monooxygenase SsuD and methylene tetrahydromethanopterin reductase) [Mesorhizobium qingshengii]